jgi:hypothetical protein
MREFVLLSYILIISESSTPPIPRARRWRGELGPFDPYPPDGVQA